MGRLIRVSFAGVDNRTSDSKLRDIQDMFPMVEFGILCSNNWAVNGDRYLNPTLASQFEGLNLCAHLCGSMARQAALNNWGYFAALYGVEGWSRAQLNLSLVDGQPSPLARLTSGEWFREVIIQSKSCTRLEHQQREGDVSLTMLMDVSGGLGIESDFLIADMPKAGYAGGIGPDNVVQKVTELIDNDSVGDFWIDMESGVRTRGHDGEWFDTSKVKSVLERLQSNGLI